MSTLRRRLMRATKKSPIPSEYQLVEYIYSSGYAHLNTEVYLTDQSVSILDCEQMSQPTFIFYGYYVGSDSTDYRLFGSFFDVYDSRLNISGFTGRITWEVGNNYVIKNGVRIGAGTVQSFTRTTNPMWLFGVSGYASVPGYVFRLQINNAFESKDYDFYPVKRKADGVVGLYDIINNKFVYDDTLIAGPDAQWQG